MIDPITLSAAVSGATAAYNGIKKAIYMGREIEDLSSQLSTWMKAVSDVDNIHKNANNPSAIDFFPSYSPNEHVPTIQIGNL